MAFWKGGYKRDVKAWFIRLLRLKDSTHRIALGAAIGMFIAFTPTVGIQMLLVVLATWLIPGNRTAGIPMVWITNPFTAVPIYTFNYEVGRLILRSRLDYDLPAKLSAIWNGSRGLFSRIGETGDLLTTNVAWPLWFGSIVVAAVCAIVTYFAMYYLVDLYRRKHKARLARRALRDQRAARDTEKAAGIDENPF